jgi:hypothetical protein
MCFIGFDQYKSRGLLATPPCVRIDVASLVFLVPKLQLGNAVPGKAPALSRGSGASYAIYVPKLELGNEMNAGA